MKPFTIARFGTILLICLSLLACKNEPEPVFKADAVKSNVAPSQSLMIGNVIAEYLNLKNALVATKPEDANSSAIAMRRELSLLRNNFDAVATEQQLPMSLTIQMDSIHLQLNQIVNNKDKSCEPQRIYFKYLSDNVSELLTTYEVSHTQLYTFFCPMAMNGKGGAWWLSNSKNVKNPYFGSKMLTCGELVDTLQ